MNNDKPPIRIESVCIVHKDDHDPVEEGMEEIGIFVEAEVSYPISRFLIATQDYHEHRRIETLKSSGRCSFRLSGRSREGTVRRSQNPSIHIRSRCIKLP